MVIIVVIGKLSWRQGPTRLNCCGGIVARRDDLDPMQYPQVGAGVAK
ncbi:MAG: hypothetical protein HIU85_04775 [Proteobacteria bacterium]|nr:hypothetical protein [Pseudomonadota bacterium]